MKILGIVKASLIDYPKMASTVLFIGGCNFRCGYCHNPSIVLEQGEELIREDVLSFLAKRRKFLDGVVISGGEPTLHPELMDLIKDIRALGYAIKLDTNGTRPDVLKSLIADRLIDYIAMDIKAPLAKYAAVTGVSEASANNPSTRLDFDLNRQEINESNRCKIPQMKRENGLSVGPKELTQSIKESIKLIKNSGLDYEFRTTICKKLLSKEDIMDILEMIRGARKYCLQRYKNPGTILGAANDYSAYSETEMQAFKAMAAEYVEKVMLR